jgi:multidrug efflux pump subunit AcrB
LFDQSLFVRAAVDGVIMEAAIAACLTALMILLFLGSWRSTLIVAISIPLSILCSIVVMSLAGQTLNVMTLGGLALAVGILIDDATVEIENIHRNLGQGKPIIQAILDGAQQIATPAFVSTLSICIVFVPVVFLTGAVQSLLVTFANEQRQAGHDAISAVLSAGFTRLRPALMTALAMIIGMLPMALGFGEGGEQNAPLGRAVIGGLSMAIVATLFFVPVVYSVLRRKQPQLAAEDVVALAEQRVLYQ